MGPLQDNSKVLCGILYIIRICFIYRVWLINETDPDFESKGQKWGRKMLERRELMSPVRDEH